MNRFIITLISIVTLLTSCKSESKVSMAPLKSDTDSLAYVIGMSIADNLIEMDSTINIAVVCRAIAERGAAKSVLEREEAKMYYLRYLTYVEPERKRGYENQYLEDLVKKDRTFTRSRTGLTYNIAVIGNESLTPKAAHDLLSLRYTISRINGEQIYSSYTDADTLVVALNKLKGAGLVESVKMIGKGGKVNAWIPSELAFGEFGDSLLSIAPFETLYYEIELVDMERNGAIRK